MNLTGRRILVTGASSGIGRAVAIYASQLGAEVVLTARRAEALTKTRQLMENESIHSIIAGDLKELSFVKQLVEQAGRLDGLVYAAGVSAVMPVGMLSAEKVEAMMRVNCTSFLELMSHYAGVKNRAEQFSVVAVSSVSALAGWMGASAYAATKGALSAAVRSMAIELAPKGIRVNTVCPSSVDTPLIEPMKAMDLAGFMKKIELEQPLGLARPEQIASVICFLLSEAASFITGVELPVDGGYLAK